MVEKIHLTFLGTGSAIPTKERNHPALLLKYKNESILFDCGEGTQRQFRKADEMRSRITRIFITHWHGDHTFGLPGLMQTLGMNNYSKTLKIYGPKGTENMLREYDRIFFKGRQKIDYEVIELKGNSKIEEKEFIIEAEEMDHDSPCLAYSFIIKEKTRLDKTKLSKLKLPQNSPLIGKLQKGEKIKFDGKIIDGKKLIYREEGKKITYITDTRLNKNMKKLSKDSNILICEATYLKESEDHAEQYAHLTSEQVAKVAKEAKVKELFLIHLSQRYQTKKLEDKVLLEAKKMFKNVKIPKDLEKLEI